MHEQWADKFWILVDKDGPVLRPAIGECWIWTGSRLPKGYGRFYPRWRVGLYAHRVSWEMANGIAVPDGLDVRHECDNPPCVRPSHLVVGTKSDNMQDMLRRGRGGEVGSPGELHPAHKLTEEQVLEIRRRWVDGGVSQRELAVEFGVTRGLVGHIVRRVAWRHL